MNIQDYVIWRGDLSFKLDPFNEVDNVVLSYLVYTDLTNIAFNNDEKVTIKEACDKFYQLHSLDEIEANKSFIAQSPYLLKTCSESKRFKDLKIHHFVNEIDLETSKQFSAMCVDLDDKTTYISYCGTDDTIVGWKEDFQMSYQLVPSQVKAKEYLEAVIKPGRKYYVGGHSKGGNLALYACCKANPKYLKNIIHIYSNDGPGLSDELFNQNEFDYIKDRYTKIIPYEVVIGYLFYRPCHTIVIKSSDFYAMQHKAMGWQVCRNEFIREESASDLSQRFADALNHLLTEITFQQREQLVTDCFEALDEAKIYNVSDVVKNPVPVLKRLLVAIHKMNPDSKKIALKFTTIVKEIINSYVDDYTQIAKKEITTTFQNVKEGVDDYAEKAKKGISHKLKQAKEDVDSFIEKIKRD